MLKRWAGPLVAGLIVGGVALIVAVNLDLNGDTRRSSTPLPSDSAQPEAVAPGSIKPVGFREYPIGDPVEKNFMRIAAVWLPPIQMDGTADPLGADTIHLEADIHSTQGNPNGFAQDEFIPYMEIAYKVIPAAGGAPIHQGKMIPMIAGDGLHYGASVTMPDAGEYRLVLNIQPPSAGGLGRHSDPVTGVAPWWEPFETSFDWDYEGPPQPKTPTPAAKS